MSHMRVAALTLFALGAGLASAHAATITFDALPVNAFNTPGSGFVTDGFNFTSINGGFMFVGAAGNCTPTCADNGTRWVASFNASGIRMARTDLSPFTLLSLDFAETFGNQPLSWADAIQLTGTFAGGGTIVATLPLDKIDDGSGPLIDFQSTGLAGFVDVSSVDFVGVALFGRGFIIDNLGVADAAAVPEPASFLLLATGLCGGALSRARRRRRLVSST